MSCIAACARDPKSRLVIRIGAPLRTGRVVAAERGLCTVCACVGVRGLFVSPFLWWGDLSLGSRLSQLRMSHQPLVLQVSIIVYVGEPS